MATLIHDCPYCGAKGMTFTAAHASGHKTKSASWNMLLICSGCGEGVVTVVQDAAGTGYDPLQHLTDLQTKSINGAKYHVLSIEPKAKPIDIPEHLPLIVAKAFKEGCDIIKLAPNSACAAFRRALELALKDLSPDIDAWKLEKRIDRMAAEGKLTPALKDWAHQLRLDGNVAVHEDDATLEEAQQIESLTRFVLLYLFTLPESVRLARPST
jgi:hypothetical protein